jgi:hypothetical protein
MDRHRKSQSGRCAVLPRTAGGLAEDRERGRGPRVSTPMHRRAGAHPRFVGNGHIWKNRSMCMLASCSKRRRRSAPEAINSGSTLTAIMRSRRVSRARYTSPMPPAPSVARISYGPSLVPEVSAMRGRNYSLCSRLARLASPRTRASAASSWHEPFGLL